MIDVSFIHSDEYIFGEVFEKEFNRPPNIYYSKIDHVWQFLQNARNISSEFVLITHNGDYCVTQEMANFIESIPNLKIWFGQNINCNSNRIKSIPIGLENTKNWTKFSKKDLLYKASQTKTKPNKLAYANFSFYTNPIERGECYYLVKNSNFVTDRCSNNVVQEEYENWINEVLDHYYVLCPSGNGIDTHRFWETLYLGRIPITKRNLNTRFYEDLPALYIDDWSELTEDLLISKLDWFKEKKNFNFEKLKMNYWKKIIFEKINKKLK